ncbi:hypothetical protein [Ralstonia phage RSP15]|uniref:hypothetical protein n=1 Tax=Ralstonia phage RSP15 TaxID=1785960 RepID=UPI00074D4CEC|nr:hypothetical protein BH754_gp023 [Ralstonia phage RSP15]BAU39981.1 hypothetical protein [Ralstonia phage RSP15]
MFQQLQLWILRRIIRNIVSGGFDKHIQVASIYKEVRDACREEFYEDNQPTIDGFTKDCFKIAESTAHWEDKQRILGKLV